MSDAPHHQAAFINVINEEGTKAEAVKYLQETWNELCEARARIREMEKGGGSFQSRVQPWMKECFGPAISADKHERNHRFLEEALELVQANGCTQHEAHQLVDYVYGRDVGEINQEVGGVMVTLAALCLAADEDMHAAGEKELARVWTKVEKIRAKQAAKPKHSPLPQAALTTAPMTDEARENIVDEIEEIVGETHDLDVTDRNYAENIVGWLERHHPAALSALAGQGGEA